MLAAKDVKLGRIKTTPTDDLHHLLLQFFPGPVLATAWARPQSNVHQSIHEQIRLELMGRGVDAVGAELVRLENIDRELREQKRKRRKSLLTNRELLLASNDKLKWLFKNWAKYPPIGGRPGTVSVEVRETLDIIAKELVRRKKRPPVAMPRCTGESIRARRRRTIHSPKRSAADARQRIIQATVRVVRAVGRRHGAELVTLGAAKLIATIVN